ncbi:DUF4465 domain-containing protein [Sphingobacterium paucimobilis]|uniref:Uncharacterized protein n=1 Tax=Sphingobacterium paucimobilis HER1398 TaxID=1346330 RepID=U2J8U8_9SPHI|nr:DUF4465 domain-containing protein [Sphingobacterium paucimobilis]ERJ61364.1 hypothetical protein M472_21650 [Sphingobacterium paucimobilis HER1398]
MFTTKTTYLLLGVSLLLGSCSKETKDSLLPYPEDITFNELEMDRFSFRFIEGAQSGSDKAGFVSFSGKRLPSGDFEGFALSNKNYRSYPWSLSHTFGTPTLTGESRQAAIDSTLFSVFTNVPNRTENYLVGNAANDKAVINIKTPAEVEHVLVANTTYGYLQTFYGSTYSGTLDKVTQAYNPTGTKVRNPLNPNTSTTMYGVFYLPQIQGPDLIRLDGYVALQKDKAGNEAKQAALQAGKTAEEAQAAYDKASAERVLGQVKLIIEGYSGGNKVGEVTHLLAVRKGVDPNNPTHEYTQNNWVAVGLRSLGKVDQLRFKMDGDYRDTQGTLLTPQYFCLDGIRIKK